MLGCFAWQLLFLPALWAANIHAAGMVCRHVAAALGDGRCPLSPLRRRPAAHAVPPQVAELAAAALQPPYLRVFVMQPGEGAGASDERLALLKELFPTLSLRTLREVLQHNADIEQAAAQLLVRLVGGRRRRHVLPLPHVQAAPLPLSLLLSLHNQCRLGHLMSPSQHLLARQRGSSG